MKNVDIKQNALEGVYLGVSKKDKVIRLNAFENSQSCNQVITGDSGAGMNFIVKPAFLEEHSHGA